MAASLLAAAAARPASADVGLRANLAYRSLANPKTGDQFLFRLGEQQRTRDRADAMFQALYSLLGGQTPTVNFVGTGSDLTPDHMSATPSANAINVDPFAAYLIADDSDLVHSVAVNQVPHEDAHLRQVTTSTPDREGGAQAFADLVTAAAARKAGIPYTPPDPPDAFDGGYRDYVKQAQARGRDWLLFGQFGRQTGPTFP